MGYKWEVLVWADIGSGYQDYQQYAGGSLLQALRAVREARKNGIGCVTLKWRS